MSKKNTDNKPMSKGKFAFNVALVVIQVAIVIVAIAFSVSILLSTGYESSSDFGDSSIRLMPVLTDSMNGDKEDSFKAGDLIIVKKADAEAKANLKVGDIVTYLEDIGTENAQFVTHRIVDIEVTQLDGFTMRTYYTMGDAETSGIMAAKTDGDIQGIYVGKLPGVGSAVFWLQDPTHFFLVIMLPLILLLLYNAYLVVRIIIEAKLKKQREQLVGATSEGGVPLDEEEIKRRAIEEYIKKKAVEDYLKEQETNNADAGPQTSETENQVAESVIAEEKTVEEVPLQASESEDSESSAQSDFAVGDVVGEKTSSEETQPEAVPETETTEAETSDGETEQKAEQVSAVTGVSENADEIVEEKEKQKAPAKKTTAKKTVKTADKSTAKSSATGTSAKKTTSAKKSDKVSDKKTTAKTTAKTSAKSATGGTGAKKTTSAKKTTKKSAE